MVRLRHGISPGARTSRWFGNFYFDIIYLNKRITAV